ncbi:unnamed protein product [Trichobilharzia szidati]|nr:unnamed protein product [Trichobilharzia szidati]
MKYNLTVNTLPMMRNSIRRRPLVCSSACSHSTCQNSHKKAPSSSRLTGDKRCGTIKKKTSNRPCSEDSKIRHDQLNSNDNIISNSSSANSDSPKTIEVHEMKCVNSEGDINHFGNEHCCESMSNQSIFYNLLTRLEEHLDEERKTNARLQAELMDKSDYEKQISDMRSSYEAEVLRLQNVITRLQEQSHHMPRIHQDGEKSTESKKGEMKELINTHNNNNINNNNDKHKDNADLHKNNLNQNNKCVRDFTNFEELKKEYEKQELLISGYQRENEKLYAYIKNLKKDAITETQDSKTAKRLTSENLSLRIEVEQLNKELKLRSQQICTMLSGNSRLKQENRISELEDVNRQLQLDKEKVVKDLDATRSELTNMNLKVNNLERDKSELTTEYECFKQKSQADYQNMKEQYEGRIEELQKKLRWYVENQAMLNKDTKKLQTQAKELEKLQRELAYFKSKQASDTKPVEKKHPDNKELSSNESGQSFLLERIKFLENELERAHENEKRAIRSLQQQYERVKLQYEDRIKSLEANSYMRCTPTSIPCPTQPQTENNQGESTTQRTIPTTVATTNTESSQVVQEDSTGSTRKDQSVMISTLLCNLRNQICHLKTQLKQRQKTIEEMKYLAEINNNSDNPIKQSNQLNRNSNTCRSKVSIINKRFQNPRVHEIKSRQINVINNDKKRLNHARVCKI